MTRIRSCNISIVGLVVFLIAGIYGFSIGSDSRKLHTDAVVIDMHNDVVQRMIAGEDLSRATNHGHSDLPRFLRGGVDAEFFSVWVPPRDSQTSYSRQANIQIDTIESFIKKNSMVVGLATTAQQVEQLMHSGKFAILLGLEGGHQIDGDTNTLKEFRRRGVRYMTLTWNNSTNWATSATDEEKDLPKSRKKGLTAFGTRIVRLMDRIGMIVDVSHLGEKTFWDVLKVSAKPVIASHSSVWSLCKNRRNLKDDQIRAIAKSGGVVCINFAPQFLDGTFAQREKMMLKRQRYQIDSLNARYAGDAASRDSMIAGLKKRNYESIRPPLSVLIDHFDYVAKLVGPDHVGIGSDFDGIGLTPHGMDDVSSLPALTDALVKRGYSDDDIIKILGGNVLRVLQDADAK